MAVGAFIAAQLYWPALNFNTAWLSYGRLRPLHTNAVIFAFGGSALFATSLHIVQRTCHVRLYAEKLASFVFWGWQLVIVSVAITSHSVFGVSRMFLTRSTISRAIRSRSNPARDGTTASASMSRSRVRRSAVCRRRSPKASACRAPMPGGCWPRGA